MNVKIALLAFLMILVASTIAVTTITVSDKEPSIKVGTQTSDGVESHYIPLSGDPREGGWPNIGNGTGP